MVYLAIFEMTTEQSTPNCMYLQAERHNISSLKNYNISGKVDNSGNDRFNCGASCNRCNYSAWLMNSGGVYVPCIYTHARSELP